jgi:glycosyltransferase involved in cell wall biosynthesis
LAKHLLLREARRIGEQEMHLALRALQTWTLTKKDQQFFQARNKNLKIIVHPIPATTQASPDTPENFEWDIGILGTWTWETNAVGLQWFVAHVIPLLPVHLKIAIAGKGAKNLGNRVVNLGFVPDATAFLTRCRMICIPSISGSGIQVKTLDAIATGRPIIATHVALRGIENPPPGITEANTPQEFAGAILENMKESAMLRNMEALVWSQQRRQNFLENIAHCLNDL